MRKIGFYLQIPQGAVMTGEGMTRVHTNVIQGLLSQGFQVFLAFPYWHEQQIKNYFNEHNIVSNNLKYVTHKNLLLPARHPNFSAILSDPFLLVFYIPIIMWLHIHKKLPQKINTLLDRFKINRIFDILHRKFIYKKALRLSAIFDNYFNGFIRYLNRKKITDTWIIDMISSNFGYQLNKNLYVFVADCAFIDFPVLFASASSSWLNDFITYKEPVFRNNLHKIKKVMSFNADVRQRHVINYLDVPENNACIIKHAPIRHDDILAKINPIRVHAIDTVIDGFIKQNPQRSNIKWLVNKKIPYFIYSTQERPHKNLINLVSAYNIILRHHNISCKLILTTDDKIPTPLDKHIRNLRLDLDVVRLPRIDNTLLAALYANAHCAINSSLFEGGFPYTFSEALSVDTPCIMSDITCVGEEITSEDMRAMMLFDPKSVQSITNAMLMTFSQRQVLLEKQQLIFDVMKQRTDKEVAEEYVKLFQKEELETSVVLLGENALRGT